MTPLTPKAPPQTTSNAAPATPTETLLNCGLPETVDGELRLPAWDGAAIVALGMRCRSATLRHRYNGPALPAVGDADLTRLLDLIAETGAAEAAA